jgi:GDP-D-mannose dehydratase
MKKTCITGITGQVGSYLAEQALKDGHEVYGLVRRCSTINTQRIDHLYDDPNLKLVYGDLADYSSLLSFVGDIKPDYFFNMGAMSHVRVSFDIPEYTFDSTGTSVIRCLEAIRRASPKTRFLQASTSVAGNTKVLVKLNDETQLVRIDSLMEGAGERTNYSNLKCLTVDDKHKIFWSNVGYVFKHNSDNIYKLKGSGGLDITITGDHSVIVFNEDGELVEKKVESLTKNDFLISYTSSTDGINPEFNLAKFGNNKQYLSRSNTQINYFKINPDIMRLFGYYVAEGSLYHKENKNSQITFTFHIKETHYTEDIKNILKEHFGINNISEREVKDQNVRRVHVSSKQLCLFIRDHFGKTARGKRLPPWMFNLPQNSFMGFLRGYIGDASIKDNEVRYTSANQDLIETLAYLSKLKGLDCCVSKRYNKDHLSPQKTIIKGCWCFDLIFRGRNADLIQNKVVNRDSFKSLNQDLIDGRVFRKLAPSNLSLISGKKAISKRRALGIKNINKKLKAICDSDLHIVRIKSIEKIDTSMAVYDLHVPETQRFIGGNYPILLHNSEMFGASPPPQNEDTPFHPRSPYAVAKVAGYWATINYREAYKLHASNSITFNTESPRRGETFVTRKITRAATRIRLDLQDKLVLGNLDAKRDWTHTSDMARAMRMILELNWADDFVIASGHMHSVKEFLELVFSKLGLNWKKYVEFDPRYLRPAEVDALCGDASKLKKITNWEPKYSFERMVDEMIECDMHIAEQEKLIKEG